MSDDSGIFAAQPPSIALSLQHVLPQGFLGGWPNRADSLELFRT